MKKLKRSVAVSVSLIMALSLMPQMAMAAEYTSAYADYFTGWSDWSGAQADNSLKYMCVTDEIAHSGNHSILIRHVGEKGNNQNICLAQSGLALEAGTYTISFWAVGTKTDSDIQGVTLADPWRKYSMKNLQAVATDGIWSKYEIEVAVSGTETAMTFVTDGDTEGWYIDDISLVKDGTTNNRIKNGGFEFTNNAVYTDKYEKYFAGWGRWDAITPDKVQTFSCVTDAIAHDGNNSVVIRHTDSANAWKAIVVVQEGLSLTGTYTFSFWAAGDYATNTNCITVNGEAWEDYYLNDFTVSQSEGLWKKYTIDITIPDGKTDNAITFASNGNTNGWYIDDISLIKQGTTENLITNAGFEFSGTPTYTAAYDAYLAGWVEKHDGAVPDNNLRFTCVTNEIAHSGDHAVAIRHADSTKIGGNLIGVRQLVSPLEGATYTLSFWAVATGTNTDMLGVTFDGTKWDKTAINDFTKVETDGIWSKYSKDIAVTDGNYKFTIFTDGETEGWYIDDISLVKQGTTRNLLVNGGFESDSLREEYTESYASYFAGWGDKRNEKTADKYLCVAGDVAHSGEHSLHMRHTDTKNTNTIILSQNVALKPETYNISFWATGDYSLSNCKVVFYTPAAETEGGVKDVWVDTALEGFTQSATDGEWTKYEKTVSLTADVHVIRFTAEKADTPSWYIDDISLTKQGTTKNILKNAGFELTEPEPDETTPAQDFSMSVLEGSTDANGNLSMAFVSDASIDPTEYKTVKFGFTKDGTTTYKGYALNKLISTKLTLGEGAFVGVCLMDIPAEYEGNVSMWLSNDTLVE